jgi:hypothetical protein
MEPQQLLTRCVVHELLTVLRLEHTASLACYTVM